MKRDLSAQLSKLSVDELLSLQVRITEWVAQRTREQIMDAFNEFASRAGLASQRTTKPAPATSRPRKTRSQSQSKASGFKPPIKYRDPANPQNTWTGRGVPPRWLQAYLDAGHQREEYLVPEAETTPSSPAKRGGRKGRQAEESAAA